MIVYGRILDVKFRSESFHIMSMVVDRSTPPAPRKVITISGHFHGLLQVTKGSTIGVIGDWTTHAKYGPQLVPAAWEAYAKTSQDAEFFLSDCVEGFGNPALAALVASKFGSEVFQVMTEAPDRLRALFEGDDPLRLELDQALEKWRATRILANLGSLLSEVEISPMITLQVFHRFGDESLNVVRENPYRLVQIEGISFAAADRLAKKMGIYGSDIRRVEGAVLWFLHHGSREGHLFMRRGELPKLIDGLVEHDFIESFDQDLEKAVPVAVDNLATRNDVLVDPRAGVYLKDNWRWERDGAKRLAQFMRTSVEGVKVDIDTKAFLADYERGNRIELSDAQRDGVAKLLENRVLVLTGLPGTGKTTLVKAFVNLFRRAGVSCSLMAPTGIATKRLAAVTGSDTATIHRTFGYDGDRWRYNSTVKYPIEAVIVDEMSMVDQELFYRILDALHPTTMLVLVGDDAQLPSVGPGNVLRELLSAKEIPHVRLTQIFRQTHTSEIVLASHAIHRGETPDLGARPPSSEFQFVSCGDDTKLAQLIVQMSQKLKGRDANFQVLSPKYDGVVGVNNLNNLLREALNPDKGQKEWRGGLLHVREGDRVMVIKNDYDKSIYNGDMAKLVRIEKDSLYIRVHGLGAGAVDMEVEIPKAEASDKLRLAYCITVHKSQGSEFDTVILPLVRAHGRMRQRNLFYTALTRAKKKCWLLGDPASISYAVSNDKVVFRNTFFGEAVSEALAEGVGVVNPV
jgi:exodeoxyribonuclease V alpha subunit